MAEVRKKSKTPLRTGILLDAISLLHPLQGFLPLLTVYEVERIRMKDLTLPNHQRFILLSLPYIQFYTVYTLGYTRPSPIALTQKMALA